MRRYFTKEKGEYARRMMRACETPGAKHSRVCMGLQVRNIAACVWDSRRETMLHRSEERQARFELGDGGLVIGGEGEVRRIELKKADDACEEI